MNEVITKLNEIEEKAQAILLDAGSRKEQLMAGLEADKRALDAKYDRMEEEETARLSKELRKAAEEQLARSREKNRRDEADLDVAFEEWKEQMAEEIVSRIIQ